MTDEQKEILNEAIRHYGADLQVTVAIEEMSELTKELCKRKRGKINYADLSGEIADVSIMLEQLEIMFEISPATIENIKDYKIRRLESRIFNEKRLKENGCK